MKKFLFWFLIGLFLTGADAQIRTDNYAVVMARLNKLSVPIARLDLLGRGVAVYEYDSDIRLSRALLLIVADKFENAILSQEQIREFKTQHSDLLQANGSTILLFKEGNGGYWLTDIRSKDPGQDLTSPYVCSYRPIGRKYRLVVASP